MATKNPGLVSCSSLGLTSRPTPRQHTKTHIPGNVGVDGSQVSQSTCHQILHGENLDHRTPLFAQSMFSSSLTLLRGHWSDHDPCNSMGISSAPAYKLCSYEGDCQLDMLNGRGTWGIPFLSSLNSREAQRSIKGFLDELQGNLMGALIAITLFCL